MTARELSKQQAQQAEVLKAVKHLQATVQNFSTGQQQLTPASTSAAPLGLADRSASTKISGLMKGASISKRPGLLFHKTHGPANTSIAQRSDADAGHITSPRTADPGSLGTFVVDEGDAGGAGSSAAAAGSGTSRASSDTAQLSDVVVMLQQQMEQQQQLLSMMAAKLQQPGQHD